MAMENHGSTVVLFACPKCKQPYRTTQSRFSYERPGRFDCIKCNVQVHAWSGFFDFMEWKAVVVDGSNGKIALNEPHYHVRQAENGTFTVETYDGSGGGEASIATFDSRERAVEWVREQRRNSAD
jgi:hypothetical protein